ncbi:MAG TPA: Spy/CpxP family protein refolding chaperone [Burkholderiales bacterium]
MKRTLIAIAAVAVLAASASVISQPYGGYGPGYGMGPGMMGPGMMGGYGPGYGMGPGMMGPGMMGGYGPGYGMAPGMMGPGMMGGYGGGWGYGYGLDLSQEQRSKIADIQQDMARQRWELMEKLHAQGGPMYEAFGSGTFDEQAARKAYDAMAGAHKQMFESWLDARKRMDAVLTPEQREQMKRNFSGRWSRR